MGGVRTWGGRAKQARPPHRRSEPRAPGAGMRCRSLVPVWRDDFQAHAAAAWGPPFVFTDLFGQVYVWGLGFSGDDVPVFAWSTPQFARALPATPTSNPSASTRVNNFRISIPPSPCWFQTATVRLYTGVLLSCQINLSLPLL